MIGAGDLREQVVIQDLTETPDAAGGSSLTPTDVTTVRANIVPLRMAEQVQAQVLGSQVLYRVTIRHRDDVTASQRLSWKGMPMNIRAVTDPDGKRVWTEILAEVGVA